MDEKIAILDLKDELSDLDGVNDYFDTRDKNSTIQEAIWSWTDLKVDDRWQELADWAISNHSRVDDYVEANGYFGLFETLRAAQAQSYFDEMLEKIDDIKKFYAYEFLLEKGIEELSLSQSEQIDDFLDDGQDKSLKEIENYLSSLLKL